MSSNFGDIIFRRRKALNMTQEALADKVGVKSTYIGYLERGKRHASPRIASALAEVLGLNRSYLFLASNPVVREFLDISDDTFELADRPLPQALLDLRGDSRMRALHEISDDDISLLVKLSFLGEPSDKLDYVLLLGVVRRIFVGR